MAQGAKADVLIVGAGVSGLTTAVCLAESGRRVRVVAEKGPLGTTSAVAGASWSPYMATDGRVMRWGKATRAVFDGLGGDPDQHGVRFVRGMDASDEAMEPPDWAREDPGFRIEPEPPEGFRSAWHYTNPLVDMPRYLAYLKARLQQRGVVVEIESIRSFVDVADRAAIVVNCTGLASRELVGDDSLTPTRGQLVVVERRGIDRFFQDQAEDGDLTYILPHGDVVVLGGSAIIGSEDLSVDQDIADAIRQRCAKIEPRLYDARVLDHRVGLRPNRPSVRLELDQTAGFPLVHNYGHGGSGMTLSWGCANDVRAIVDGILGPVER